MEMYLDEELNERVNCCDLYDDCYNARDFNYKMKEVELERSRVLLGYYRIEKSDEGGMNSVLIHFGETMDPADFKVPKPPYDWVDPNHNTEKGVPTFDKVDMLR